MVPWEKVSFVFPRDLTLSALLYIFRLSLKQSCGKNKRAVVFGAQATTVQSYSGQDTFEFDQGHVTKNQPITVLVKK